MLFFSIWKLLGVTNFKELREKVGTVLPRIPKNPPKPGERTEFSGINDFLGYIIQKDKEEKLLKEKPSKTCIATAAIIQILLVHSWSTALHST